MLPGFRFWDTVATGVGLKHLATSFLPIAGKTWDAEIYWALGSYENKSQIPKFSFGVPLTALHPASYAHGETCEEDYYSNGVRAFPRVEDGRTFAAQIANNCCILLLLLLYLAGLYWCQSVLMLRCHRSYSSCC